MAVEQRNRGHRVGQQFVPKTVEHIREEPWCGCGVFEIESVGVEFRDARGRDDDAGWVVGMEDVERETYGIAECLRSVSEYLRV